MARTRKLKPRQQQANAQNAREDAFEAAVQANPELYRTLKDVVTDTRDAYWEIEKQYRALSMARSEASNLRHTLKDCGMDAEAAIAEGLLAVVERAIQPILEPLRNADDAYELAKTALEKQFLLRKNLPKVVKQGPLFSHGVQGSFTVHAMQYRISNSAAYYCCSHCACSLS